MHKTKVKTSNTLQKKAKRKKKPTLTLRKAELKGDETRSGRT